jgi:thioredoxin reductase (NADPH)
MKKSELMIIGSGPAGYTAALYAARADLNPILFEGEEPGGQLMLTTDVENYPGFPEGVQGPDMMELFKKQAERFGTEIINDFITDVDFSDRPFTLKTDSEAYEADSVIIATGASAKWLGIPGEYEYQGHGVSACATCDGFFFKDKHVVVIGGGDSAMEEATFLTKFASKVTVMVRRDELRASNIMAERAKQNDKIEFMWHTEAKEVLGEDGQMTGLKIINNQTEETREFEADGMFVAIGHKPNTDIFTDWLDCNKEGYVIVDEPSTKTSIEGVFAAGDVADYTYRQAVTAAGSGCKAALDAERWLAEQSL